MVDTYLKNNLLINTNNDKVFMIEIIIECGAINESKGIRGFSHLLEHIKFNKFKNSNHKDIFTIESGSINAYTSKDQTAFYIKCNEDKMKDAIELLINIVFNTDFSNNKLANEKKIVFEEMYMSRSKQFLYNVLFETIMNNDNLYSNHIIGSKIDLEEATNEKLKLYNNYFYTLDNASIVCSCSTNKVKELTSILKKNIIKYKVPLTRDNPKQLYNTFKDDCDFRRFNYSLIVHNNSHSEVNAVYLIFKTHNRSNSNFIFMYLINFILASNNHKSLLFKHLREDKGLIYNINNNIDSYKHFGAYCIGFNTSTDNVGKIVESIFEIMEDYLFTKKKMNNKMFEDFKKSFLSNLNYQLTNNDSVFEFVKRLMYLDKMTSIPMYINKVKELSHDDFMKICNDLLSFNRLGCYIMSKKLSKKEHANAFITALGKFKNEE